MKYSVLCPTRNRALNLIRFINSMVFTCSDKSKLEFLFYIDNDDQVSVPTLRGFSDIDIKVAVGPRIIFCQMFNVLAQRASNPILFMTGDDIIMRTQNWDLIVEEEFNKVPDDLLVVSTRDGIQNDKLATHSFISRTWTEVLGYLIPPIFPGDWADNWLTDVSKGAGRLVYKPEIFCEHMHPNVGKGPLDDTYIHKFQNTVRYNTEQAYHQEEMTKAREADINKLKDYIETITRGYF